MTDQPGFFDRNWQTNNCGCDLQGCQACDPYLDIMERINATPKRKQAKQRPEIQPAPRPDTPV